MDYDLMNLRAFMGTAEELKEMLFKYGHDKNNVLAIQYGLDGESNNDQTIYQGKAKDLDEKKKIMAAFRAKTGDFAPQSAESKLAAEYNRVAAEVEELKKQVVEKDKTIETLKISLREDKGYWGH
jgi:hypothetical protein